MLKVNMGNIEFIFFMIFLLCIEYLFFGYFYNDRTLFLTNVRSQIIAHIIDEYLVLQVHLHLPASNEDTIYVPLLSATGSMGAGADRRGHP